MIFALNRLILYTGRLLTFQLVAPVSFEMTPRCIGSEKMIVVIHGEKICRFS